jgi:orotate phosphoribosyltransferase
MPQLSERKGITVVSQTFPPEQLKKILETPGVWFCDGHFEYPVRQGDLLGNHLDALFILKPIAQQAQFVDWIVDDISRWIQQNNIEFDTIFAPAQDAVKAIAHRIADRNGAREVYWEYHRSGRIGSKCVEGEVKPGDRVLVFNGVSLQGRSVGERLPAFVDSLDGTVVAAAVFAKGTAPGVVAAEQHYGNKLYSAIQVDIKVQPPDTCIRCASGSESDLVAWTELRDRNSQ